MSVVRSHVDAFAFLRRLRAHLGRVLAAFAGGAVAALLLATLVAQDTYAATARIFVVDPAVEQAGLAELQAGALRAKDCQEALNAYEVQIDICRRLGGIYAPEQLPTLLEARVPEGSRVVAITACAAEPNRAADLANASAEAVVAFFGGEERISLAVPPSEPEGPGLGVYALLGALLGGAVALTAVFFGCMLDTSPRTAEEVAQASGLKVLAEVPHAETAKRRVEAGDA